MARTIRIHREKSEAHSSNYAAHLLAAPEQHEQRSRARMTDYFRLVPIDLG
jgi:hypothetical protein